MSLATFGKQAAVRVFVNLPVTAKLIQYMKKELTFGTPAVPAHLTNKASKPRELLNKVLPADCQIKTARDAWYVGAIGCLCLSFVLPPAVLGLAYCVMQAKKGGENERH